MTRIRLKRKKAALVFEAVALLALSGCQSDRPRGAPLRIAAPLGLPPVPIPDANPPTAATVALGRKLFFDKRLSLDNSISCASCHDPARAFGDARPLSSGVGGTLGTRNAPTVINAAYLPALFWDGRAPSLEEQAGGPVANPKEMKMSHALATARLEADAEYRAAFEQAFGPGAITFSKIAKSIASYERTLLAANSPFDRYAFGNDPGAMSKAALRGLAVFTDSNRGNCASCHTIMDRYALFTDGKFHNIGIGVNAEGEILDQGHGNGAFRTPTLRNVALTAPYMHDGSLKTLRAVVDYYIGRGNSNPHLDPEMKKINLTPMDRADLLEFLSSLTGEVHEM